MKSIIFGIISGWGLDTNIKDINCVILQKYRKNTSIEFKIWHEEWIMSSFDFYSDPIVTILAC